MFGISIEKRAVLKAQCLISIFYKSFTSPQRNLLSKSCQEVLGVDDRPGRDSFLQPPASSFAASGVHASLFS